MPYEPLVAAVHELNAHVATAINELFSLRYNWVELPEVVPQALRDRREQPYTSLVPLALDLVR